MTKYLDIIIILFKVGTRDGEESKTMKAARNIVSVILVLTMLVAGLPVYHPIDINRDNNIGLDDVILNVRDVARSAEDPAAFGSSIENAISSLQVTAGLKTVIKPSKDSNAGDGLFVLDFPCLISHTYYSITNNNGMRVTENKCSPVKSIEHPPIKPPPRHNEA